MNNTLSIKGNALIAENKFKFIPTEEVFYTEPQNLRGNLIINEDASAEFKMDGRCAAVPPTMVPITAGNGCKVKRSSRNYIIQIKVPIFESRAETQERLEEMIPRIVGDITVDRKELFGAFAA